MLHPFASASQVLVLQACATVTIGESAEKTAGPDSEGLGCGVLAEDSVSLSTKATVMRLVWSLDPRSV